MSNFSWWRKLRHRSRVTILSTLASSVVLGFVLLSTSILLRKSTDQTAQQQLGGAINGTRHRIKDRGLAEVLDRLGRNNHVAIALYGRDGKAIAKGGGAKIELSDTLARLQVPATFQYRISDIKDGFPRLVMAVDWSDRYAELRRVDIALLCLWPALTAVLALATYAAVGNSFRPLNRLLKQSAELGLDDRLQTEDAAEFGELAASINTYLDTIQNVVKQQEEFAVDAAHELCTPLTAMRGQLELVLLQKPDSKGYAAAARNAIHQMTRLQRLVESLLMATRPHDGAPQATDVQSVVEEVQARWVDRFAEHHVSLDLDLDQATAGISPEEIDCVVDNLLANAFRFSPSGSKVAISLTNEGLLSVQDQGPGIPEENRERVFERFERGTTTGRGFGIGLYLARRLLERSGGSIRIGDSKKGTRVEISLPPPTMATAYTKSDGLRTPDKARIESEPVRTPDR